MECKDFFCFEITFIREIVTLALGFAGMYFSINYYIVKKRKLQHEMFDYYNSKYAEMNKKLKPLIKKYEYLNTKESIILEKAFDKKLITEPEQDLIYEYLNICSEQYYWFNKKGLIESYIWNNWFPGMVKDFLSKEIFMIFIKEEIANGLDASYYGFLEYLKSKGII